MDHVLVRDRPAVDIKPNMQDLSFDTSKTPRSISYDDESNIHDDITLTFLFPDGKEQDVTCKTGETVSNLKKKLLDEYQIPFSCKLTYKSTTMLDPLSLNDFPELLKGAKEGKPVIEISV